MRITFEEIERQQDEHSVPGGQHRAAEGLIDTRIDNGWEVLLSHQEGLFRMAWLCRRIFLSKASKDWVRITLWNWF